MYSALITTTLALVALGTAANPAFEWDCTKSMTTCNNACYAVFVAGKPGTLTYDNDDTTRPPRRTASGCNRTPCSNQKLNYKMSGNSCDEYPFASTFEGGSGAILRCATRGAQSSEGGQLSRKIYQKPVSQGGLGGQNGKFDIFITNYNSSAPFCGKNPPANDGFEFQLRNGAFVNVKAKRQNLDEFVDHVEDAARLPSSMRREFVLENGARALRLGHDNSTDFIGRIVGESRILMELL